MLDVLFFYLNMYLLYVSHPMSKSLGEAPLNFVVCFEKLVGEVLSHEGKHQIGSLRVWLKCLSLKKPFSQHFGIRKNSFTCREINMVRFPQEHSRLCIIV